MSYNFEVCFIVFYMFEGENIQVCFMMSLQMKKWVKDKDRHQQAIMGYKDIDLFNLFMETLIRLKRSASCHLKNLPLILIPLKKKHGGNL